jgi:uncharacterized membrane protein HdeD (DUF308 family)
MTMDVESGQPGRFVSPEARAGLMSAALANNWWAVLARGLAAIAFGLVALLLPGLALTAFVLLFAAYALVDGIFAIVSAVRAVRHHERWVLLLVEGVVSLVAAAVAALLPLLAVVGFVILVAAWAIVTGVLGVAAALRLNVDHGRTWMIIGGVASIVLGVALLAAPLLGAIVLTWWIAAYALIAGISLCVLAFRLRARRLGRPASGAPAAAA